MYERGKNKRKEPTPIFNYTGQELAAVELPCDWMYQPPFSLKIDNPYPQWMAYPEEWMTAGCSQFKPNIPYPQYSKLDEAKGSLDLYVNLRAAEQTLKRIHDEFVSVNRREAKMYYLFRQRGVDPAGIQWDVKAPSPFDIVFQEERGNVRAYFDALARAYPDQATPDKVKDAPLSAGHLEERFAQLPATRERHAPPIFKELDREDVKAECAAAVPDGKIKFVLQRIYEKRPSQNPACASRYKADDASCYTYLYNAYLELQRDVAEQGTAARYVTNGSAYFFVTDETIVNRMHNDFYYPRGQRDYLVDAGEAGRVEYDFDPNRRYRVSMRARNRTRATLETEDGKRYFGAATPLEPVAPWIEMDANFSLIGKSYINMPETIDARSITFGGERYENVKFECRTLFNDTPVGA